MAAVDILTEDTRETNEPIFTTCVELFRAAQFLLLHPLLPRIQSRLGKDYDWKLKKLCAPEIATANAVANFWYQDLAKAIRVAYKAGLETIKKIFMEFAWAGRRVLLSGGPCDISFLVGDTPEFIIDLLHNCATKTWLTNPIWAPKQPSNSLIGHDAWKCGLCKVAIPLLNTAKAEGQVTDPFTMGDGNAIWRQWCRKCSERMGIPWRHASY